MKYSNILEILNVAFDKSTMSKTMFCEWYKSFQDGCEDVETIIEFRTNIEKSGRLVRYY